jgi:hypothetical protein
VRDPAPVGEGEKSDLVLATHDFRPSFAKAIAKNERQNPDLRQKAPAVDPAAVTIMFCKPRKKERNKRKRNAERRRSATSASCDAARALQGALAFRRSTTALT